jgi:hypothetical protein
MTARTFDTEGQHCSDELLLHDKNSHNSSNISVFVKPVSRKLPRVAEVAREPKPSALPDVDRGSECHFPQQYLFFSPSNSAESQHALGDPRGLSRLTHLLGDMLSWSPLTMVLCRERSLGHHETSRSLRTL